MRKDIQRLREQYPKGSRVELLDSVTDPYHPLPAGSKGTVWAVDDAGQLHIEAKTVMEEGLSFVK